MTILWLRTSMDPHKNELIHRRSWGDVVDVEIATFEWVTWWNESRLHQSLGYRTPAEVEA
ncbi:integrase core domain-containing protein [Corynebacterium diphtheriae]